MQLDKNVFPAASDGGYIVPKSRAVPENFQGTKEHENERQRSSRSPAGARQRAQGREGQAGSGCSVPSVSLGNVSAYFRAEFEKVLGAYPDTQVWEQDGGAFLRVPANLLPGLGNPAIFIIAIRFAPSPEIRSWAFWSSGEWIGPRHTNRPDGSICAFDASNPVWVIGQELYRLVDIYAVWALRHLHLKVIGRWPGRQLAQAPFERLEEMRFDELCGCDNGRGMKYQQCCLSSDTKKFISHCARLGPVRRMPFRSVPYSVKLFFEDSSQLPDLEQLFGLR